MFANIYILFITIIIFSSAYYIISKKRRKKQEINTNIECSMDNVYSLDEYREKIAEKMIDIFLEKHYTSEYSNFYEKPEKVPKCLKDFEKYIEDAEE